MAARRSRYETNKRAVAYLYIAPFFVLFAVFGAFPAFDSFYLSFTHTQGLSNITFVGFDNFVQILHDDLFWIALGNTAFIWIFAHLLILPGGFVLAFLLNYVIRRGANLFQTIYFTPLVTSSVAVTLVFFTLFGQQYGLVNYLIALSGGSAVEWLGGTGVWIKPIIIVLFAWRWVGYNMVIYLAGLQGIDNELYDCARVEGASNFQMMMRITVPLMRPIIFFTLMTSFIGGLQIFDEPYMLLQNRGGRMGAGTNYAGLVLARYLYYHAFNRWNFGYASAIAYVLVAVIVALSLVSNRLLRRRT